jgi:hypothetical protein
MAMGPQESVGPELVHLEQAEPLTLGREALGARLAPMVGTDWNLDRSAVAEAVEVRRLWPVPAEFTVAAEAEARRAMLTLVLGEMA